MALRDRLMEGEGGVASAQGPEGKELWWVEQESPSHPLPFPPYPSPPPQFPATASLGPNSAAAGVLDASEWVMNVPAHGQLPT